MWKKLALFVLLTVTAGVAVPSRPSAWAQTPTITVTPDSGNQDETFTINGSGFVPGTELEEAYFAPDGARYTHRLNGERTVVVTGADGAFSVSVHPAVDFQGALAGAWTIEFCIRDTSTCWVGVINISL